MTRTSVMVSVKSALRAVSTFPIVKSPQIKTLCTIVFHTPPNLAGAFLSFSSTHSALSLPHYPFAR